MGNETRLEEIRHEIDRLDVQIQKWINERAALAQEVAQVKQASLKKGEEVEYYRPEREAQVLHGVMERNHGPLGDKEMARLFREIMSACLALEKPMMIAFLGPEGTFTEAAAYKHFGNFVLTHPVHTIPAVFQAVESGRANYGIVPVENSIEGGVNSTLDELVSSSLQINGEVELRIHQQLIGWSQDWLEIRRIYSHQQSFAQCREWLAANLPEVEKITVTSNAEAVKIAANEPGSAAIAGEQAAEIYGVPILQHNIETDPENTTRFLVIGKQAPRPSGNDRTSLLLSTRNRPGALSALLAPFSNHGVSMSKIESRPSHRGNWDYLFLVDIEGHVEDELVAKALEELQPETTMFRILGSYPKAVL